MKRIKVTHEHLGIPGESSRSLPMIDPRPVPPAAPIEPTRTVEVVVQERRSRQGAKLRELIDTEQRAIKTGDPRAAQEAADAVHAERLRLESPKVWHHWPRAKES